MRYFKTYKRLYQEALREEDYRLIDEDIMREIWDLKWLCRAYEKYARSLGLDPLQADEQNGLSLRFADSLLGGTI